jgi:hypothetical protein
MTAKLTKRQKAEALEGRLRQTLVTFYGADIFELVATTDQAAALARIERLEDGTKGFTYVEIYACSDDDPPRPFYFGKLRATIHRQNISDAALLRIAKAAIETL